MTGGEGKGGGGGGGGGEREGGRRGRGREGTLAIQERAITRKQCCVRKKGVLSLGPAPAAITVDLPVDLIA